MAPKTKLFVAAAAVFVLGVASTLTLVRVVLRHTTLRDTSCEVADIAGAKSVEDRAIENAAGLDWLSHARVCLIGGFTVVVPASQTKGQIIRISKGLKPVFERTRDGTLVFSPMVPDQRFDQDIVNIWHPCEGDVTKLIYTTRGKEPHITVEDRTFSGLPNERMIWNGGDVQETFVMYEGTWHQMQKGRMLIDGQWQAVDFIRGEWRIKDPNDTGPPVKESDAVVCVN